VATTSSRSTTYLDSIVAWHRAEADADTRDPNELRSQAETFSTANPVRDFGKALRSAERSANGAGTGQMAVIAEIKRRSPSKGDLAPGLDPVEVAHDYTTGGAAALSVLTDEPHFGGSVADLRAARGATHLPVLRKDFTVSANDICDARLIGADAVLLIVAALTDAELSTFASLASALGLSSLVEVHDEAEAERALDVGALLIGVNQRDLRTFEVDTERAVRVAQALPSTVVKVAESGITGRADMERLAAAGYDAVLVGETLITSPDRRRSVAELAGASI
jgi:indole-3-glycerol phosphate synthase